MNIDKAKKPIHIRCPYCKKDLQYNGASIKSQKEGLIKRLDSITCKYREAQNPQRKKALLKQMEETKFRLRLLSEDVHMLSQMSEMEVLKIYKRKTRDYIDKDTYKKLLEEAEKEYLEENTFNYYDLAIQNYTNFEGV